MKARFVTFHYVMKDSQGNEIKTSYDNEPMMFLEGQSQIMPVLENELKSLKKGDKKSVLVRSADGYGSRDEKMVVKVPLTQLPPGAKLGQRFSLKTKEMGTVIFTVTELGTTAAILDGNHPLAGKDLVFDVEILEARPATKTDLLNLENEAGAEAAPNSN